ncbi:PrsW family intramembrane metalloprotease [Halobacteriales archaeon QS_4_66_20]|nr:MAG: PrsW family intramembrane metalloprotease [Halobacteriales archaeon QS_4_66_20]
MRLRNVLRIARWEVTKNAGGIDRRTLAVAVAAIALLGLIAPLAASGGGPSLDDGLYHVGVDDDSQYYDVVRDDDTFVVRRADRAALGDSVDLLIEGDDITAANTQKGEAARQEFRSSVQSYNNRKLRQEVNATAAFPVSVLLEYREQSGVDSGLVDQPDGADGDGGAGDGTGDGDGGTGGDGDGGDGDGGTDGGDGGTGGDGDGTGGGTDGGDGSDGDGRDDTGNGSGDDTGDGSGTVDPGDSGDLGGITGPLSGEGISGSPADISPPFPFQSLVLAFVFVIPMNFLIQAYGSTILSERINRRGELLLVSPVSRYDIIAGKTLPYFAGAMVVETAIAAGVFYLLQGQVGGLVSVFAVAPLVLLFLGATFLGAMFARSFKELTFVTVTITVSLTSYAFVPAIFTDVDEIALISPLTLVVRELQGEAISLGSIVFSTTPPLLVALVCFGLGAGLYREEDMFAQRSVPGRVIDALAGPITRRWHVGVMTAVLVPFVFVVQLLAIAALFALGEIAIVLLLVVVAITEEFAKSLHVYAAYEHRRFERSVRGALVLGFASGLGFFLAEKIALLAQLVGLEQLAAGEAGLSGGVAPESGPILLLFLLAPLALHAVTASISAVGASRGKGQYLIAVAIAMGVHLAYNLGVVLTYVQ